MVKPNDCEHFNSCDAPLCPYGEELGWLKDGAWFTEEPMCTRRNRPSWVKTQQRIVRKLGKNHALGFFTVPMLKSIYYARKNMTGIDVDTRTEEEDVKKWIAKYANTKRELTGEALERARNNIARSLGGNAMEGGILPCPKGIISQTSTGGQVDKEGGLDAYEEEDDFAAD
jgi:hypothetical protein